MWLKLGHGHNCIPSHGSGKKRQDIKEIPYIYTSEAEVVPNNFTHVALQEFTHITLLSAKTLGNVTLVWEAIYSAYTVLQKKGENNLVES